MRLWFYIGHYTIKLILKLILSVTYQLLNETVKDVKNVQIKEDVIGIGV